MGINRMFRTFYLSYLLEIGSTQKTMNDCIAKKCRDKEIEMPRDMKNASP